MHIYLRYFFISLISQYIFSRLINQKASSFQKSASTISSILVSLFVVFIHTAYSPILINIFILVVNSLVCLYLWHLNLSITLNISIISILLSYFSLLLFSFITAPIGILIISLSDNRQFSLSISMIIAGILQFIFYHNIFKIKRLSKGMPFMYKHKNGYAITVFSSILLLTITLVSVRQKNDWIFVVFCFPR